MQAELSHRTAKRLFAPLVDDELGAEEAQTVRAHLDRCADCRRSWQTYEQTVLRVRALERERAPDGLATAILQRTRRKKLSARKLHLLYVQHRVPVEGIVVILLAASIAALIAFVA
jgi:anti-sigma factor RsiW